MAPKKLSKKQKSFAVAQLRKEIAVSGPGGEDGGDDGSDTEEKVDVESTVGSVTCSVASAGAGSASTTVASVTAAPPSGEEAHLSDANSVFEKALAVLSLTSASSKRGPKNTRGGVPVLVLSGFQILAPVSKRSRGVVTTVVSAPQTYILITST